jgi:hypothetical protein
MAGALTARPQVDRATAPAAIARGEAPSTDLAPGMPPAAAQSGADGAKTPVGT